MRIALHLAVLALALSAASALAQAPLPSDQPAGPALDVSRMPSRPIMGGRPPRELPAATVDGSPVGDAVRSKVANQIGTLAIENAMLAARNEELQARVELLSGRIRDLEKAAQDMKAPHTN